MFVYISHIDNFFWWITVIKSIHHVLYEEHTTPCGEQTNIHYRFYNNNSDCVRNTKSYFTSIEPDKNQ